jgi:hypothetical protein
MNEDGALAENGSTRWKTCPIRRCSPQIPHRIAWHWIWASTVKVQPLTTWTIISDKWCLVPQPDLRLWLCANEAWMSTCVIMWVAPSLGSVKDCDSLLHYISVMMNIRYCLYLHSVDTAPDTDHCIVRYVLCPARCVSIMRRFHPPVPPQRLFHGHIFETGVSAATAGDKGLNPKRFKTSCNRNLLHKTENLRLKFDFLIRIDEDRNTSEIGSRSVVFSILKCFRFSRPSQPRHITCFLKSRTRVANVLS